MSREDFPPSLKKVKTMLMQIDGTFIFVVISFLIFLFIIKAILYAPITKIIEERNGFYAKNSKMESESKEKTKALLNEKDALLKETRNQASDLIKQTSAESKQRSELEIKKTKKEIQEKIEQNKNSLMQESDIAKKEIKNEVENIVQSIVKCVLNENIEINLEDEKINNCLKI